MHTFIRASCAAAVLWAAAPVSLALAQPATAQAIAPAPSAKATALVRRLFVVAKFEAQMDNMLASMIPVMIDQQIKQRPGISAAYRQVVIDTTREAMREVITPKLVEAAVPLYAQTYSETELEQIIAFYESPGGQAMLAKAPLLAPKVAEATRAIMPEAVAEMTTRLCAKLDCSATTQPTKVKPT